MEFAATRHDGSNYCICGGNLLQSKVSETRLGARGELLDPQIPDQLNSKVTKVIVTQMFSDAEYRPGC